MIERLRYINPKSSFDDKLSLEHFVAVNKVNVSKDQAKMINTDQQNKSHKKRTKQCRGTNTLGGSYEQQ